MSEEQSGDEATSIEKFEIAFPALRLRDFDALLQSLAMTVLMIRM
jgi:hypothetical protein